MEPKTMTNNPCTPSSVPPDRNALSSSSRNMLYSCGLDGQVSCQNELFNPAAQPRSFSSASAACDAPSCASRTRSKQAPSRCPIANVIMN
jgi:hypothetical protein